MDLISKCVQVMQAGGSDQWDDSYPNREIIAADIDQGSLFVCMDSGAIAGIIVLDENQAEQYGAVAWEERQGPHLVMHRLAVHPEFQGKGIARQLIAFAEEYARRNRYSSIRMDTYAKNERVLKIYPGLGYVQRGEIHFPAVRPHFQCLRKSLGRLQSRIFLFYLSSCYFI